MRGRGYLLTAIAVTIAGVPAHATESNAKEHAYTMALLCAGVASYYKGDADIQRTMDAVRKMGIAQGYDSKRVSSDAIQMAKVLGVELRSNPNAMAENRALCRKLKLLS